MRSTQGNNQTFGAQVNRIKITGMWASKSLTQVPNLSWRRRLREYWGYAIFRSVLFSFDAAFFYARTKAWILGWFGRTAWNFEDEVERSMQSFAKGNLGVDVDRGFMNG